MTVRSEQLLFGDRVRSPVALHLSGSGAVAGWGLYSENSAVSDPVDQRWEFKNLTDIYSTWKVKARTL